MGFNFESEEDIKSYLNNISTEYQFSCEKENNAEGCHLFGDYTTSVKRDYHASAAIYKENCDKRNYAHSCFKYASQSFLGKGCETNIQHTFDYFKKACELKFYKGCFYSGVLLTTKEDKKPFENDYVQGLKYLEEACKQGIGDACYTASTHYIAGAEGVPVDRTKAAEMSRTACSYGILYACSNLSLMYKRGDGVEKNEDLADFYKQKALELKSILKKKRNIGLQQYT